MATTTRKHTLGNEEDLAQNNIPAAKQRKLNDREETMGMAAHLYDIEVKLYSDAKAARNDPKPPGYYGRYIDELLAKSRKQNDAAATAPDHHDDSGGAAVGPMGLIRDTPAEDETAQPSDNAQPPTNAIAQRSSSIKSADDPREADFDRHSQGSESYIDEDEDQDFEDVYEDEDNYEEEDEYGEDLDECEEWDWLEAIDSFAYSKQPSPKLRRAQAAGVCSGKLIRRDRMRQVFHYEIEEPSNETAMMGFDLFDRYGRLKPEFTDHPIKKGSGIWGKEMNHGDILLIEEIQIQKPHRRHGLGSKLVSAILDKTRNKTESFVAITRPAGLVSETEKEISGVTDRETRAIIDREDRIAILFWRSLGFRRIGSSDWFALAGNTSHPCHTLPAADDYNPPAPPPRTTYPVIEPLFEKLKNLENETCLKLLQDTFQKHASDEPQWVATDEGGNTLLHTAALNFKPECVKWILEQSPQLTHIRNHEGYTPLEALTAHLEYSRTRYDYMAMIRPVSDRFSGFPDASVACAVLLKGQTDVQRDELLRLKFGCTCGECISGFLSPRMQLALHSQAEIQNSMSFDSGTIGDGNLFVEYNDNLLTYLPRSVRDNLKTNKSMRQGFVNMWNYVATCLREKVLPTEPNVLDVMRAASEWPPDTKNYLQRGGTVKAVASMVFKQAMNQDKWSGDGEFLETFADKVKALPKCRNDHEFGFVSGMCGYKRVNQIRYFSALTGEEIDSDKD